MAEQQEPLDWQEHASCGSECADPADFTFREGMSPQQRRQQATKASRAYCDRCPVIAECLQLGRDGKASGVYGGMAMAKGRLQGEHTRRKVA